MMASHNYLRPPFQSSPLSLSSPLVHKLSAAQLLRRRLLVVPTICLRLLLRRVVVLLVLNLRRRRSIDRDQLHRTAVLIDVDRLRLLLRRILVRCWLRGVMRRRRLAFVAVAVLSRRSSIRWVVVVHVGEAWW